MKREKSLKVKVVIILTVLCALITFISAFPSLLVSLFYLFNKTNIDIRDASSIGIIGGADGPTAIFISGQTSLNWLTAIFALLTVLGIIYLVITKYKKNHN